MKNKLKWHYDKQNQESFTLESYSWANDGFSIKKYEFGYKLHRGSFAFISSFKHKKNAMKVAELIAFG